MNGTANGDGNSAADGDPEAGDADPPGTDTDGSTASEPIVAKRVRRVYGDVVALDGVNLTVEAGEVFGLIGPNGAGKTTLVRALTGTTDHDGDVRLFGSRPTEVDADRIGLLPQSFDPPARLTARELVAYYGGLYDDGRDVDAVLRDVGMESAADVRYETLSGGQRRRTCVATALVNDPDLLFLDEPTTGIDPAGRRSIHRLIEELAADGTTVFLTSHAMDEVQRLADRVGLMRDGRLVAVGSPRELIAEHGGEPWLEAELRAPADDDRLAAVASALRARGLDAETSATAGTLRLSGIEPAAIGDAVAGLDAAGVDFESLSWSEPSLEDVYLRLTGERYDPRRTGGELGDAAVGKAARRAGRRTEVTDG